MSDKYLLECCVDSVESAIAACKGGADRLELCSNLVIGGTTPTLALFNEVRKAVDIPIHILIRPRFGDFLYTDWEANIINNEIISFKNADANGIVIGSLNANGSLNVEHMKRFMEASDGMSVTFHRAFDMCRDPFDVLEQSIELGINTILTSGQAPNCVKGINLLNQLIEKANERIAILAGSGITTSSVELLLKETTLTQFHMSGKTIIPSNMEYRNPNVSMGIAEMSEYEIWRTDENAIRQVRKILDSHK